jgi:hypothetical protein
MPATRFLIYPSVLVLILAGCSLTALGSDRAVNQPPTLAAVQMDAVMPASTGTPQATGTAPPASPTPEPPTPTVVPDTPVQNAAGLAGCQMFPASNIWNVPVDSLPVDPDSDSYVNILGRDTHLHPDFGAGLWEGRPIGIPYNTISGGQPSSVIEFYYPDESDPGPYPIPPDALIEGGAGSDGDRHILIMDQDQCMLYEIYDAQPQADGSWQAGSGAVFDLKSNALRPSSWTSADAAGLPILPGLVRYDEVAAGLIPHALRFTASDIRRAFVWPARHRATCGGHSENDMSVPPMGQRFRLKAGYDISSYPPDAQVILTALKRYGMMLADCGSDWFITGAPDSRWNDDAINTLKSVPGSAFEAVDVSGLMQNPDSAETLPLP